MKKLILLIVLCLFYSHARANEAECMDTFTGLAPNERGRYAVRAAREAEAADEQAWSQAAADQTHLDQIIGAPPKHESVVQRVVERVEEVWENQRENEVDKHFPQSRWLRQSLKTVAKNKFQGITYIRGWYRGYRYDIQHKHDGIWTVTKGTFYDRNNQAFTFLRESRPFSGKAWGRGYIYPNVSVVLKYFGLDQD